MCTFCAETVKENVQLPLNIFFYVEGCVAAPRCISMFLKERGPLLLKDISERLLLKENVQLIFFVCVAASRNISVFFNEREAASEKILKFMNHGI